ncbi:MAG: hypothetical protein LBR94_04840, partial [Desulfovibrio sp.]|nr:hypothetical protein [Desulfovibrio sp.]
AGGEVLELRTDAEHILLGGGGDDAIAGSGEDILYGGAGDDAITAGDAFTGAIYGGAGDDAITVGSGDAALYGGAGDDAITLGAGFTGTAYGGVGNDIFVLSSGADPALVDGGEGLDFLLGAQSLESAEDMLNSGTLTGMDVVVIGPSSGITTVENLADYGITVSDGNKVVLDESWTRAGDKIGTWEVQENYDAYTTTTESGDLTLLVAKTATETSTG